MNSSSKTSEKLSLLLALTITLVTATATRAQQDEFFDVEPHGSKPKPQAEAPRAIIMDMLDEEQKPKTGKLSFFHRSGEKKQIASKDGEIVKDVPDENPKEGSGLSRALAAPKSAAGVMCGLMVGVPVRAAKSMASETRRMNSQIVKDFTDEGRKPDLTARMFGAALSVPYGVATGMVTGVVKGSERAVHTGSRKPLTKESMSITDPEFR